MGNEPAAVPEREAREPDVAQGAAATRIVSLDQFRGYTVLGMFVVNFIGYFAVTPAILKHHNTYCSLADTIMPQFFFAVGFAFRMTFLRRLARQGRAGACLRVVRRALGLVALGALLYVGGSAWDAWRDAEPWPQDVLRLLLRDLFQTLVHIAATTLWVMPVIAAGARARIGFALGSAGLHLALSHAFYYRWVTTFPGIDGGPLGFLSWTVPVLAGSLAYDLVAAGHPARAVRRLAAWGLGLMLLGYALACVNLVTEPNSPAPGDPGSLLVEPPFVPPTRPVNLWTMNQRAGSLSYLTFGAGLSMALYGLFVWACDAGRFQLPVFRTLGTNALAAYVLHILVDQVVKPYTPKDWPVACVLAALAIFLAICYLGVRLLEWRGLYLRL